MVDEGEDGEIVDGGHGAVSTTPTTVPTAGGGSKMVDECDEDGGYGAVSAAPTKSPKDSTMEKLKAEFNIKEFFELASRVIDDGDSESMEMLKNLKIKWMTKLGGEIAMTGHGGFRSPSSAERRRPRVQRSRIASCHTGLEGQRCTWSGAALGFRKPQNVSHGATKLSLSAEACDDSTSKAVQAAQAALGQSIAAPPSGFTEPKAHGAPHRPLAAASTAEPSLSQSRLSRWPCSPPTPLTATTEVTEAGSPSPTWAAPPLADIWPSSSPLTAAFYRTCNSHRPLNLVSDRTAVSTTRRRLFQLPSSSRPTGAHSITAQVRQHAPPVRPHPRPTAIPTTSSAPVTPMPEFFIGNVPMHPNTAFKIEDDKIAAAFHNHRGKHLTSYHLDAKWRAVCEVKATSNGFFFFQFENVAAMEEVIEGGPWLYLGQPIVLQKWEPGMVLRKLKHTEVPIWIKLRHLPVELWTTEGLSTVASGIGRPLYPDAITRACTRLDFARVCVMLNVNSKLPKHVVIMMPNELGGESACKVDVEYEWIPHKCTGCLSLGHSTKECPISKPTKPAVSIYVRKSTPTIPVAPELKLMEKVHAPQVSEEIHHQPEIDRVGDEARAWKG
ncbi:UNVERIFIED_CONTAM: hypothetical protein Scaly_3104900 [Sesamum calycinum]|uniref:DUF4283 domain-containing protein n=1 Tax=Sesamum calycinum TaxID=2727403 RepID=A0AAW2JMW0_9LAMI